MPALNSRNAKKGSILLNTDVSYSIQALSHSSLEVGSMAEVISLNGLTVYGVIRWIGVPEGKKNCWAGLELVGISIFSLSIKHVLIMWCFVFVNNKNIPQILSGQWGDDLFRWDIWYKAVFHLRRKQSLVCATDQLQTRQQISVHPEWDPKTTWTSLRWDPSVCFIIPPLTETFWMLQA